MLSKNWRSVNSLTSLITILLVMSGCDETKTVTIDDAFSHYDRGAYRDAYEVAKSQNSGQNADSGNFIAGLSAYRLGKAIDAIRHLKAVSNTSHPEMSTTANATLGLIYEGRQDYSSALRYYTKALKHAKNEDLARTHYQVGVVQQKLGQWSSARSHFSLASTKTRNYALKAQAMQKLNATGFTIQLGAYASRSNANKRAVAVSSVSKRLGFGSPRIVMSKISSGATRYLVQVGRFSTYESARSGQRRLGQSDSAVASLTTK